MNNFQSFLIRIISVFIAGMWLMVIPVSTIQAGDTAADGKRPKIGLVLGGGGARGAAHVGVLKVLEELRIPIDIVVGTSMGSIVGGLYATGMTPAEIEREMLTMDWYDLFQDAPRREDRSFRRKRDDDLYAFDAKLGVKEGKIEVPLAYIRGQKLHLALNRLTLSVAGVNDFDRLPIPYRAVATDLQTGKEVVIANGDLVNAIRASMAVPAVFDPVEIDGRLLADGGLANNVPVSVARALGAEVLIVVDVGAGLYERKDITTILSVTSQLTGFLFTLNTEHQLSMLHQNDVLIRPLLGNISGGDFTRVGEAVPLGETAAHDHADMLQRYSLDQEQYLHHLAQRVQRQPAPPVVDFIRINNLSHLDDAVIASRINAKAGEPLDVTRLETDIAQVYGLEIFESVQYEFVHEDGKTGLVVTAREKSWGPAYLQFGLASSNDMQGDALLRLGVLYTQTQVNALNGEWRIGVQIGDEPGIFTELHQPLDPLSRYFISGRVGYLSRDINQFDSSGNRLAIYQVNTTGFELGGGREFGTWGEGRLGFRRESGDAEISVGTPAPKINVDRGELFVRLSDDKLDDLYFPRSGHYGVLEYRMAREQYGASDDYEQWLFNYIHAFSRGQNTLIGGISTASTVDDDAPLDALFELGGFLRLSGLQEDELSGQHAGLISLVYMRRLLNVQFFKSYAGVSLELGNVWQRAEDIALSNSIAAGSVFIGFDTPIGPLYIGYGRTDSHQYNAYIYLGPRVTL